jgi:hypothetical protein
VHNVLLGRALIKKKKKRKEVKTLILLNKTRKNKTIQNTYSHALEEFWAGVDGDLLAQLSFQRLLHASCVRFDIQRLNRLLEIFINY